MSVTEDQIVKRVVDRSRWGAGPWDGEPDRFAWRSDGVPCLVQRSPLGAWCGYVGVQPSHPWFGKSLDECAEDLSGVVVRPSVHGGVTYAAACAPEHGICHVPEPGEPDDLWWIGFDCAHAGDLVPGLEATLREVRERTGASVPIAEQSALPEWLRSTYRTIAYAKLHVEGLADQARTAARVGTRRIVRVE